MWYHVKNKTTGEIRYGHWNDEYLIFLSFGGNIHHKYYYQWDPLSDHDWEPREDEKEYSIILKQQYNNK